MNQETTNKTWNGIIVALISATGLICAATIGLGSPLVTRLVDVYIPTYTPIANTTNTLVPTSTEVYILPANPQTTPTPLQTITEKEILGENLIPDGSFDNGFGNWNYATRHEAGIIYPAEGYSGNGICSRQNLNENDEIGWVGIGRDINVQAGKTYKYSAWVKWENATQFGVHIEWRKPIEYVFFQVIDGTLNTWQLWEARATVPNDVSQLRLSFWHGVTNNKTNVPGGIICVDEVTFQEVK